MRTMWNSWHVRQPVSVPVAWSICCLFALSTRFCDAFIFFPRGASFGYLAAVAMPLDIPNRNAYVAFNFEANYGLPPSDSYNQWIDNWNADESILGVGNNVTAINGRQMPLAPLLHTRNSFYSSVIGYLEHFRMNGTACLLRTVCEVAATNLDETNGLLGSVFKILFMPTTSRAELPHSHLAGVYTAELMGNSGDCAEYTQWCPQGLLNMISAAF